MSIERSKYMEANNEELNTLINTINDNMRAYDRDIKVRMKISDNLEIKRLKQAATVLFEELSEFTQGTFALDLEEETSTIPTKEESTEECINPSMPSQVMKRTLVKK